jgi:hypothetical protein
MGGIANDGNFHEFCLEAANKSQCGASCQLAYELRGTLKNILQSPGQLMTVQVQVLRLQLLCAMPQPAEVPLTAAQAAALYTTHMRRSAEALTKPIAAAVKMLLTHKVQACCG